MLTLKNALGFFAVLTAIFALTAVTSSYAYANSHGTKTSNSGMNECMAMMSHTGDADADFIKNMVMHHQMALDMAKEELDKGKDSEARDMAQNIIDAQTKEIS